MKNALIFCLCIFGPELLVFMYMDLTEGSTNDVLLMVLAIIASYILIVGVFVSKGMKKKKENAEKQFNNFYDECQRYSITDLKNLSSAGKKQRAALIGKKYGLDYTDPALVKKFDALREKRSQQEAAKREQAETENRQREQEQLAKLTHYAQFHGTDKPVTMLKDMAKEQLGGSVSYIPMRKESDGMIMAGIASGIGGTVPALMSLSQTAQSNETIRQQNQATQAINMMLAEAQAAARETARKYRKKADEMAVKLIDDTDREKFFQNLKFTDVKAEASYSTSITVEAEVAVDGEITVFDKPGFIDGYVVAELYDGAKKLGEALLVFPPFGSDSYRYRVNESEDRYFASLRTRQSPHYGKKTVRLRGTCLDCGEAGKTYTVKFVPGDLWVMER